MLSPPADTGAQNAGLPSLSRGTCLCGPSPWNLAPAKATVSQDEGLRGPCLGQEQLEGQVIIK